MKSGRRSRPQLSREILTTARNAAALTLWIANINDGGACLDAVNKTLIKTPLHENDNSDDDAGAHRLLTEKSIVDDLKKPTASATRLSDQKDHQESPGPIGGYAVSARQALQYNH